MCVVLSVSPATSKRKKKNIYIYIYNIRQIVFAQHGTSAFMQTFAVGFVHPNIDTHKNQLIVVKKRKEKRSE